MSKTRRHAKSAAGHAYEPNWLVSSAEAAANVIAAAGGRLAAGPDDIPVGKLGSLAWRRSRRPAPALAGEAS